MQQSLARPSHLPLYSGLFLFTILMLFGIKLSFANNERNNAVDAVVIMDSSGSMKKTDPKSLRKPAAKLFISLLNDKDRASMMSFSDNGYPITYLNTLDTQKNIDLTLNAADKVSTLGIYTNIHAAIERAYKIFEQDPSERQPMIILLSDGKMDVGNEDKSLALARQLLEETTPKLIEKNIKVYSIAFTDNSDRALLTEVSEKTGGFCKVANNDEELHLAFTSIFEQSKAPDMLPLTENSFLADESIKEITIVASKAGIDSKIFLETPDKQRFDASIKDPSVKWFISETFDMITLKNPTPGQWKILFSDNNNKAYIVADVSMKSSFEFTPDNNLSPPAERMTAQAWLEKEDNIVTEQKMLDSIEASIELVSPTDQVINLPMGLALNNDALIGKFIGSHVPQEAGMYFATVTLKSQTFERQKTFSFNATGIPQPEPEPQPAVPETPTEQVQPEKATQPEPEANTDLTAEPVSEEDDGDLIKSVIIFIVINVIIAIVGLLIYLIIKLKKARQAENETDNA